MPDLTPSTLTV